MCAVALNRFMQSLAELCGKDVLTEKWLLAPNLRVGMQWLDAVARSGQPMVNVRVKTLRHLALDLAQLEMARKGFKFLRGQRVDVLVDKIFALLQEDAAGYLSGLTPGPGLMKMLRNAIHDMRLAGLNAAELKARDFEVDVKGREIRRLLGEYEKALAAAKLADYADVLGMAEERIKDDPEVLDGVVVIMPQDALDELEKLERALWDAFPDAQRQVLTVDRPGEQPDPPLTDLDLLRWFAAPAQAPTPKQDGAARIFCAVGEVNEVREVLRRCVEEKIPLDQVEVLHTDRATYAPLILEVVARLMPAELDALPVTFTEGVPARYSRPGRALAAWLSWVREDFPQAVLVRMIQDGLLVVRRDGEHLGSSRLGQLLRSVPIGGGREAYVRVLQRRMHALKGKLDHAERDQKKYHDSFEGFRILHHLMRDILDNVPGSDADQQTILCAAASFLKEQARGVSEFDEYARKKLLDEIEELASCLEDGAEVAGLDVWQWLAELAASANVLGRGPRAGCLYVAPFHLGGHSGRRHTFIIGLDDARFPGAGMEDPLLLDSERGRVSRHLRTASGRRGKKGLDFARLLARLRGQVTLSYCCHSITDDRDMFSGSALLAAFRILSGKHEGDQEDLLKWLPPPASFAPDAEERCLDSTEWWLWRFCEGKAVANPETAIAHKFSGLGQGFIARDARASDVFTEYDGYVPAAGKSCDPTQPKARAMSASRLETFGKCPMEYLFRYVLEIEPPEEYEVDPSIWLDHAQQGSLLHEVFREFMVRLHEQELLPDYVRDEKLLYEILDNVIARWRSREPPPNDDLFDQQVMQFRHVARIFLMGEQEYCRNNRPLFFEAAIGMRPVAAGTELDRADAMELKLPNGKRILARGYVDRIDEVWDSDGECFTIWDYKTGNPKRYNHRNPFNKGRVVQNILYPMMVEACLKKRISPNARVVQFGYYFLGARPDAQGDRIAWPVAQLDNGKHIIAQLCDLMAGGCFPMTTDGRDVVYSNYAPAFGHIDTANDAIKRKMANEANVMLAPFCALRNKAR